MRVRLLGSIDVVVDGQIRPVPGLRRQALLVALALRRGAVVDKDHLVGLVWPKEVPRSAANSLQSHVSYLRVLVADKTAIAFRPPGYVFTTEGEETDVESAERLIDRAGREGDAAEQVRYLRIALDLWRGNAFGGVIGLPWLEEEADRLEQLRLRATHSLVQARLAMGEHVQLLPELEQLVRDHPFDEQMHGQLILALYRADRQVDALAAYQRLRGALNDELGIDPSPALRTLETAILRQDPDLRDPPTATPNRATDSRAAQTHTVDTRVHRTPAELPAAPAAFTGRRAQLTHLDGLLTDDSPATAVIAIVAGTAGVGKTALAVHWGHHVRDQFPDGQLFVDLRGYSSGPPLRPIDALTGFLAALGVPAEQAPVDVNQAAALFRTLAAGKRLLVVLDNAHNAEQVRPLLPGGARCVVLVTSRDRLAGLVARNGAQPVGLAALSPDEAYELLNRLLGPDRLNADIKSTMYLAATCAFLPLAVRIAAATLAWQPQLSVAEFVTQLRGDALRTLSIEDDPEAGVMAAFDSSYRSLPVAVNRLFRLLSLAPGPEITEPIATVLSRVDRAEAAALLDRLSSAHLLDQRSPGRYVWHDLLRTYAARRCLDEDSAQTRQIASRRLYEWYLSMVDEAADLLYPHMLRLPRPASASTATRPRHFADVTEALEWLDGERSNLVAAVVHCAGNVDVRFLGCLIADALRGYFHLRRAAADWLVVAEAALAAAQAFDGTHELAAARHSLGTAYRCLGDVPAARSHYDEALRLARVAGWREAEATALANLGIVDQGRGRLEAAVDNLTLALAIDRASGRTAGIANNLGNLALVYLDQGRLKEAAQHFREALDLNRRCGSRHGQALALTGLGRTCRESGQLATARTVLTEAMRHCVEVGDRDGQATVHFRLAAVELDLGHLPEAARHAHAALELARDGGDPRTEADALTVLAATIATGGTNPREAASHYARAYELGRQTTVVRTQIEALIGLADCALRQGDLDRADEHAQAAARTASSCGYRRLEAAARAVLANVLTQRRVRPTPD